MKTRDNNLLTAEREEAEHRRGQNDPASGQAADADQHWTELHQANGRRQELLDRAKRHISNISVKDVVVAAAAGFALGWLAYSARRNNTIRQVILGSLLPAASKGVHDAWESIRDSDTVHRLGDQASRFGDRASKFSDRASKLGHRASSRLTSRW